MKTSTVSLPGQYSHQARERLSASPGEPWFLSGWHDAVFLHFSVPAKLLQPFVPFELDLHNGLAYVSCVAFKMNRLRPRLGGGILFKPVATHEFLNVRTYVTHRGERGIYFLAEWLPNWLSVLATPALFGLPYRHGRLRYHHDREQDVFTGTVEDRGSDACLRYTVSAIPATSAGEADAGTLDEFLLERYTAFTSWHGLKRLFRIWHPAWLARTVEAKLHDTSLLHRTGSWAEHATFISAHHASGFNDIWMSRPYLTN